VHPWCHCCWCTASACCICTAYCRGSEGNPLLWPAASTAASSHSTGCHTVVSQLLELPLPAQPEQSHKLGCASQALHVTGGQLAESVEQVLSVDAPEPPQRQVHVMARRASSQAPPVPAYGSWSPGAGVAGTDAANVDGSGLRRAASGPPKALSGDSPTTQTPGIVLQLQHHHHHQQQQQATQTSKTCTTVAAQAAVTGGNPSSCQVTVTCPPGPVVSPTNLPNALVLLQHPPGSLTRVMQHPPGSLTRVTQLVLPGVRKAWLVAGCAPVGARASILPEVGGAGAAGSTPQHPGPLQPAGMLTCCQAGGPSQVSQSEGAPV
jgi:hypothetical protein